MSDAEPGRPGGQQGPPAPPPRGGPSPGLVVALLTAALVLLVGAAAAYLRGRDEQPAPLPSLTASPVPAATATPPPATPTAPTGTPTTPAPTPSPPPATSPDPTAPPSAPPSPRPPTDADVAGFAADFQPGGSAAQADQVRSVAADIDGDGVDEVVVASLVGGFAQVDIARWDGHAYQVVFTAQGGSGEQLDDLRVSDYTGDGWREVVTQQSTAGGGQSLSVYGWDGQSFRPQAAQGGCWDGSATYGILGASIEPGELIATCDDPSLPLSAQPSDVYRWDGQAWVFSHREDGG